MNTLIPTKRRRGGQPGNQNAKGNRGNSHPRRNFKNRGGGAPIGNQNASRPPVTLTQLLLHAYGGHPEAVKWIRANEHELSKVSAEFSKRDILFRALPLNEQRV
jgi:hypothetical protein